MGNRDTKYGLTFERVNEVLDYDPATGIFRWKIKLSDRSPLGKIAGGPIKKHWRIRIDGHYYLAHRLAWLIMTGKWPSGEVDHENRTGRDNRWRNLREATHSQNHANGSLRSDNTTGYKGVMRARGRFVAIAVKGGKRYFAGYHDTPELAHVAYLAKAKELHGDFHSAGA